MGNSIPEFYVDVITYPYPKLNDGLDKSCIWLWTLMSVRPFQAWKHLCGYLLTEVDLLKQFRVFKFVFINDGFNKIIINLFKLFIDFL